MPLPAPRPLSASDLASGRASVPLREAPTLTGGKKLTRSGLRRQLYLPSCSLTRRCYSIASRGVLPDVFISDLYLSRVLKLIATKTSRSLPGRRAGQKSMGRSCGSQKIARSRLMNSHGATRRRLGGSFGLACLRGGSSADQSVRQTFETGGYRAVVNTEDELARPL